MPHPFPTMCKEVAAPLTLTVLVALALGNELVIALCPNDVTVELNSDIVVPCNVTDTPDILFWFRGYFTPNKVPILYLQNGEPGGSEYGRGKYALTEGGLLIINKTTLQDEGPYTLRVISSDGRVSISSSNISIFILPAIPCPVVDGCDLSCQECHLKTGGSGQLTCYVNNTRPEVRIGWDTTDKEVDFNASHPMSVQNNSTWSSSSNLQYTIYDCGTAHAIHCKALSSKFIVNKTVFLTKPCTGVTDVSELHSSQSPNESSDWSREEVPRIPDTTRATYKLTVTLVVFCIITVVITVVVTRRCSLQYRCLVSRKSPIPGSKEENVNKLRKQLIKNYKTFVFNAPYDQASATQGSCQFVHCQCLIEQKKKGSTIKHSTSRTLFKSKFFQKYKRVLIEADAGYGKKSFVKEIVKRWVIEGSKTPLLIYIKLEDLGSDVDVISIVWSQFNLDYVLNEEQVDEILQTQECHFLLCGLENWSGRNLSEFIAYESNISHELGEVDGDICAQVAIELMKNKEAPHNRLSVVDLLGNNYNTKYKNLTIWVVGRTDNSNSCKFKECDVSVTFLGTISGSEPFI